MLNDLLMIAENKQVARYVGDGDGQPVGTRYAFAHKLDFFVCKPKLHVKSLPSL